MKLTAVRFYRLSSSNPLKCLSIAARSAATEAIRSQSRAPVSIAAKSKFVNFPAARWTGLTMRKPGSKGAETLRNLRTAAIQLLSEHGYGAMNLRMLAKKVGIQASSLYNYIDSKQQL